MTEDKLFQARLCLDSLSVYRALLKDDVLLKLKDLLDCTINGDKDLICIVNKYNEFYHSLLKSNSDKTFKSYIISLILYDDNIFSRKSESQGFNLIDDCIRNAAGKDLSFLHKISDLSSEDFIDYIEKNISNEIAALLPSWNFKNYESGTSELFGEKHFIKMHESSNWQVFLQDISEFYREKGAGIFGRYNGFVFEREDGAEVLKGIETPDPVRLSDLMQYEEERRIIVANTINLINGYPANNILLHGDRGTGKSTTVKALLNEYSKLGLRIIELPIANLSGFSKIIRLIKDRPQKFIIFIDDLAFSDNEDNYTALKSILEGGLESRPQNVVIYATSNRRHLVKEKFSEKEDEVHGSDIVQEKLSLSDRFGITVTFVSPDRKKYLQIVEDIVNSRGLKVDKEYLKKEANLWEVKFNGPSPRTARQFVDWLEAKIRSDR